MRTTAGPRLVQRGFTMIELMIALAAIGILAAIALPAYNVYVIKAKLSEVILAASQCRTAVAEVFLTGSPGGPGLNNWGCNEDIDNPTQYVRLIDVRPSGNIRVRIRNIDPDVNGTRLRLKPESSPGVIAVPADIPMHLSGFKCEAGVTLPLMYLPGSCRNPWVQDPGYN